MFGSFRKPKTAWLGIWSMYPRLDSYTADFGVMWQLARVLDQDPGWNRWWQPMLPARLEMRPQPFTRRLPQVVTREGRYWVVQGGGPDVEAVITFLGSGPHDQISQEWVAARRVAVDDAVQILETLVLEMLSSVGAALDLGPGPQYRFGDRAPTAADPHLEAAARARSQMATDHGSPGAAEVDMSVNPVRVSLWIPLLAVVARGADELVGDFAEAAEVEGGELVDDSESMDDWEWYEFSGLSAGQVAAIANAALPELQTARVAESAPIDWDDDEPSVHVVMANRS